jgi:hypothetical protein
LAFLPVVEEKFLVADLLRYPEGLMGTLSNFTLSKRQEMLDKSPIPEPLKETLLFSPLVKDKLFGFPLGKLQEEGSKTLEKTPLPREVVLTEGVDHHLLYFLLCTTLAFLPVVEEEFLVADLLLDKSPIPELLNETVVFPYSEGQIIWSSIE